MGLDQHRAQITADWLETETGEIGRARISPAHRDGVREFLDRFAGQALEVALEATTGWRFVVEELLAAPTCTSPSRRRPVRCAVTRSGPRPIAPTPAICGSC
jgi:hypothetical protein